MTNSKVFSKKVFLWTLVNLLLIFIGVAAAADDLQNTEHRAEPLEIQGAPAKKAGEKRGMGPVEKIKVKKWKMPEIPKAITRKGLNPAEKARLETLEQKRASGKITETEYELEKDTLARDSNITF